MPAYQWFVDRVNRFFTKKTGQAFERVSVYDTVTLDPGSWRLVYKRVPDSDLEKLRTKSRRLFYAGASNEKKITVTSIHSDAENTYVTMNISNPAPIAAGIIIAGYAAIVVLLGLSVSLVLKRVERIVTNPLSIAFVIAAGYFVVRPMMKK